MEPHFIKWADASAGQELWQPLALVLEVHAPAGKRGTLNA
jgi:hypothetical protein